MSESMMLDRFERFSYSILETYRCWHRIASDVMIKHDLKGPYAVYFTALYRHPEGLTAVQLGERCSRDKADVSRATNLMEEKGLIYKASEGNKVYRAVYKLTDEGHVLAEYINSQAMIAVENASRGLSAEKLAIFYEALELITTNLQVLSREGLPDNKNNKPGE